MAHPRKEDLLRPRETARPRREVDQAHRRPTAPKPGLVIWGRNPVITALEKRPELCRRVLVAPGVQPAFRQRLQQLCGTVALVERDRTFLDRLSGDQVHQGVALEMAPLVTGDLSAVLADNPKEPSLVVAADHCQDPHNLGALIRTAAAVGACCLVCQKDRSAPLNGTVAKASAGALFTLPVVQVVNLSRALEELKARDYWVVGLHHRTDRALWDQPLPGRMALVVGAEGRGLAPLTVKTCDCLVRLPMAGAVESLNASVAAAVALYEWLRLWAPRGSGLDSGNSGI